MRRKGCDSGGGVELVAGVEVVVALAAVVFSIPHGDALGAVDGEGVAVDGKGGALVDAESEELGMGLDDGGEIVLAVADVDVLVDGDVGEEAEADLVGGSHHDGVVVGVGGAAHHEGALNGCAGRASADDASAIEEVEHFFEGEGVEVGVGEAPVAAAFDPDSGGRGEGSDEGSGVGEGTVGGVEDGAGHGGEGAFGAAGLVLQDGLGGWFDDGCGGDDDDVGVFAAGHFDEALEVGWLGGAAGDEEISPGRTV